MSLCFEFNVCMNSFYNLERYRNEASSAIPKKCPCIAKVLAGLLIGLMLVASIKQVYHLVGLYVIMIPLILY